MKTCRDCKYYMPFGEPRQESGECELIDHFKSGLTVHGYGIQEIEVQSDFGCVHWGIINDLPKE